MHLELSTFLRGFSHPGFSLFLVDLANPDSLTSLRSSTWLEPALSPTQLVRFESLLSVLDFLHLELFIFLQGLVRSGFACFVFGVSRSDSSISVLDAVQLDFPPPLQSFVCLGSILFALEVVRSGLPISLRQYVCSDLTAFVLGTQRFEPSLPVLDHVRPGPALSVRSFFHVDLFLLVLDVSDLASVLPSQSVVCSESPTSVLDLLRLDLLLLTKTFIRYASTLPVLGLTCLGSVFLLPVIDAVKLDFAMLVQSHSRFGSLTFAPDLLHTDLVTSPRAFACSGPPVLVLDFLKPGFLLLLQHSTCVGLASFVLGMSRSESSVLILVNVALGLSLFPQSLSKLGFLPFISDFLRLGFVISLQCLT